MAQATAQADPRARRQEFEELIRPLLRALYNTAFSYLRNTADAEDAVSESVLRAYRAFDQFEQGTNFKAWVFRILTNHCINRYRRRERGIDEVAFEDIEREAEIEGSKQQPLAAQTDAAVLDQLLDEEVEEALASLPVDFRAVVILCDLQDFSYQEAAQVLDVPVGTIRSRLFRARRALRDKLAAYAVERGLLRENEVE